MNSHALPSFWKCYEELPEHARKLANKNFALFKANPQHPSLGFQKKGGVYTVEVGPDTVPSLGSGMANITGFGSVLTKSITTSNFEPSCCVLGSAVTDRRYSGSCHERKESERFRSFTYEELIKRDKRLNTNQARPASLGTLTVSVPPTVKLAAAYRARPALSLEDSAN